MEGEKKENKLKSLKRATIGAFLFWCAMMVVLFMNRAAIIGG